MGLSLHQNVGTLSMLTANSAGFFTVPSHGSKPPLPYLFCQSSAFCTRSVWETWVLLPTEPLPASGCCMCVAPASPADCNRAGQDCTCGPENKCPSPKPVFCWTGGSTCSGAPVGREAYPTHNARQTPSQQCGSCSCIAAFSCHFKAEVLLYCDLLKSLRVFNPLLKSQKFCPVLVLLSEGKSKLALTCFNCKIQG